MTDRVDADATEIPERPSDPPPPPAPSGSPWGPPPSEEVYASNAVWVAVVVAAGVGLFLYARWWGLLVAAGIGVMITIHELGHYLTARWTGMKATEFFLGFGPKLWSFQRGETEYGVKALPVGAYVRIIGMNNLDEVPPEDEPRTYRQQTFPRRLLVVLAGPATHFVQAAVIIFVLLAFVGMPGGSVVPSDSRDAATTTENWEVLSVTDGSAADEAGLESGDRVVAFDGESVSTFDELTEHIQAAEVGQPVTLTVLRDGDQFTTETEIGGRPEELASAESEAGSPFLGVGPTLVDEQLGVLEALAEVPGQTLQSTGEAIAAVGSFFSPSGLGDFANSVQEGSESEEEPATPTRSTASSSSESSDEGRMLSILGAIRLGADLGEENAVLGLLLFFLSINIFIGLLNLIPLLPFDGGHAAVAIYERIRSRGGQRYHADVTKLLPVAYAVVMALIVLGVTTMYLDVVDPVRL